LPVFFREQREPIPNKIPLLPNAGFENPGQERIFERDIADHGVPASERPGSFFSGDTGSVTTGKHLKQNIK
jgi:hypothetical protein